MTYAPYFLACPGRGALGETRTGATLMVSPRISPLSPISAASETSNLLPKHITKADALVLFGGSILTGGDLLAKSFVCLLRKESRCGENPARLDEILQRNKKKKMNLRLEPYEKERLLAKAKRSRLW